MNQRPIKWISSFLATIMLVGVPISASPTVSYAQIYEVNQQAESYEELREIFLNILNKAQVEIIKENIQQTIDAFMKLPSLNDYPDPAYVDDKQIYSEEILKLILLVEDKDSQIELYTYFATEAIKKVEETEHHYDISVAEQAVVAIPLGDTRTELATKLEDLKTRIFAKMRDDYIDWLNPPDNLIIHPYVPPKEDKLTFEDVYGESPQPQKPIANYDKATSRYVLENGRCYKITEYYKDNKLVDTKKEAASNDEKIFCGVLFNSEHLQDSNNSTGSAFQWIIPNSSADYMDNATNNSPNNFNQSESRNERITIHYTFEKNAETPYYFDTGIAINEDETLSYSQAKNALYHIAIQAKGNFAEDKDKSLALIDGVIILLVDNGKPFTMQEFSNLFTDTVIQVKALKTRSGMNMSQIDL